MNIVMMTNTFTPHVGGVARSVSSFTEEVRRRGVYVIAFSYPVVPKGQARIRVQVSAAHTRAHLDRAVAAFETVARRLGGP